ncbi:hypothetical protein C0Q70_01301 [Pomacea canaliculata]|uniref:Ion transport domain-containing protein n=1 Tax=Pomacea canaliculata TaxID=400727 RepID=A0A2T7PZ44_POMCA|nr:hypothetical protein C0Q70_01301 [Pomacea canaliculata]
MGDDDKVRRRKRVRSSVTSSDGTTTIGSNHVEFFDLEMYQSRPSMCDVLEQDVTDDTFQAEVVRKTQTHMVGRQEAEMEVIIDRLVENKGNRDKALLYVVSQITTESKVQVMVNTLLHRGANPSFADDDRQTPLHHATRRGFKGVVSKLLESDALPHARDRQNRMPIHIAIQNNADDIAALLLAFMPNASVRPLFITFGNKTAELSLHDLINKDMQQTVLAVLDCMVDAIGQSGHVRVHYHVLEADEMGRPPNHPDFDSTSKSCLHLISKGGYKNIVYHDVVRLLIRRKWKEFARFRFQLNSFLFLLTQLSLCFCAVVATMTSDPTVYNSPLHTARAVMEVWSVVAILLTFLLELNQMRKHRLDYWTDQFNWIDVLSSALLLTVVVLRWTQSQEQWPVFSVGFLLWTLRVFKYAAVFRQTGAYSQILWRIVAHDFPQFIVVFSVILVAFSGSFVLSLRGEDSLSVHNETRNFWNTLFTGVRILIEGNPVVEYTGPDGYQPLSCERCLQATELHPDGGVSVHVLRGAAQHPDRSAQRHLPERTAGRSAGLELNRAWIIARVELNSLFIGKVSSSLSSYRQSRYREVEEMRNPLEVLGKWETPPLNEMNKHVRDIWDSLESHKFHLLTIKNRLSRQEYSVTRIQAQLDRILELMQSTSPGTSLPEQQVAADHARTLTPVNVE